MNYQYTGGAHGITVQSSHTLNLETGEEYKLRDLMNDERRIRPCRDTPEKFRRKRSFRGCRGNKTTLCILAGLLIPDEGWGACFRRNFVTS